MVTDVLQGVATQLNILIKEKRLKILSLIRKSRQFLSDNKDSRQQTLTFLFLFILYFVCMIKIKGVGCCLYLLSRAV